MSDVTKSRTHKKKSQWAAAIEQYIMYDKLLDFIEKGAIEYYTNTL